MQGISYKRYIMASGGAHALLIGGLLGFSMVHGCAHAPDTGNQHDLMIDIPDLGQQDPIPAPAPTPAPRPEPKPEVKPEPQPDEPKAEEPTTKADIVLPAPDKPKRKKEPKTPDLKSATAQKTDSKPKIEISKKMVVRGLPKPTTSRVSKLTPEEIRKALLHGAHPGKQNLSDDDVRSLINSDAPFGKGDPITQDGAYKEMVRQILYRAWDQPGSLGVVGLSAHIELTVTPDGRIQASRLVSGSGNAIMDNSVMQAVHSVTRLNGIPADFLARHHNLTVAFELTGGG